MLRRRARREWPQHPVPYTVLYRERDERFAPKPKAPVYTRGRGCLPVIAG